MKTRVLNTIALLFTCLVFSQQQDDKGEGYYTFTQRGATVEGYHNKEGEKTGHWTYRDRAGKLTREEDYSNGKLNGELKSYQNGKLYETIPYVNGVMEGVGKLYLNPETEKFSHEKHYRNDKLVYMKGYYTNGNIHEEHFLEPGTEHYILYYDLSGKVIQKSVYNKQGMPIGVHKLIMLEGNSYRIASETEYDNKGNRLRLTMFGVAGSFTETFFKGEKIHGPKTTYNGTTQEKTVEYFFEGKAVTKTEFEQLSKKQKP